MHIIHCDFDINGNNHLAMHRSSVCEIVDNSLPRATRRAQLIPGRSASDDPPELRGPSSSRQQGSAAHEADEVIEMRCGDLDGLVWAWLGIAGEGECYGDADDCEDICVSAFAD